MRALWAARVSCCSLGMAFASICWLVWPSFVCCTTVALVIFVPVMVIWTCMGPNWVVSTDPVMVRVAVEAPEPAIVYFGDADFVGDVAADVAGVLAATGVLAAGAAAGAAAAGAC